MFAFQYLDLFIVQAQLHALASDSSTYTKVNLLMRRKPNYCIVLKNHCEIIVN